MPGKTIAFDDTTKNCVVCNNDKTKGNTGLCEKGCGASDFCDELPNAPTFIGGICSTCSASLNCNSILGRYKLFCEPSPGKRKLIIRGFNNCDMNEFYAPTWINTGIRIYYNITSPTPYTINEQTFSSTTREGCNFETYLYST